MIDQKLNENLTIQDESEENLHNMIMGLKKLTELLQKIGKVEK